VSAWGATLACADVEDVAYIRLDYSQVGVSGFIQVSWLDPRKARTVTVVGKEKMAVYDDVAEERLRIYDRGVADADRGSPPYERPCSYRYGDIVSPHISSEEPLTLQDQHFVDCIRRGAAPETSGFTGMAVIAVLEAIDRSLREGKPVQVDYPSDLTDIQDHAQELPPKVARGDAGGRVRVSLGQQTRPLANDGIAPMGVRSPDEVIAATVAVAIEQ
jgi:hypothetical protein